MLPTTHSRYTSFFHYKSQEIFASRAKFSPVEILIVRDTKQRMSEVKLWYSEITIIIFVKNMSFLYPAAGYFVNKSHDREKCGISEKTSTMNGTYF